MKRIVIIFAVMANTILGCFTAAAQTVSKDFDLKGFTGVELGSSFKATVQKSDSYKVSVEVSDDLAPYLDVRVSKGDIIIELRNAPAKLTILNNRVMNATISMPELRSVTLNGSSKLTVADSFVSVNIQSVGTSRLDMTANADDLTVKSAGTAVSEIDGTFDTVDLDMGGTANVTLKGQADEMDVIASSAGSVDALRMPVATATVHLSGAGVCKTYVKEALEVQCTGASTCSYKVDGDIKLDLKEIARTATLKKL